MRKVVLVIASTDGVSGRNLRSHLRALLRDSSRGTPVELRELLEDDLEIEVLESDSSSELFRWLTDVQQSSASYDDGVRAVLIGAGESKALSSATITQLHAHKPPGPHVLGSGLNLEQRLVGTSRQIKDIKAHTRKLALSDCNVLITGETGTGKELIAELIHRGSPRGRKPLTCVNCAAIPDSLLESELFGYERGAFTGAHAYSEGKLKGADGGTVFLDEIGDMSPYAQAKILRVIESKEIQRLGAKTRATLDIRVIAATNQNLEAKIADGTFRKDLYFRLNVARIHLPPLRDRKDDVVHLLDYYVERLNTHHGRHIEGFTDEALQSLLTFDWPGNIRELKNVLEAAFVHVEQGRISLDDLPEHFRRRLLHNEKHSSDELGRMLWALTATNWNKSEAAQKLRWSRMTLYRKMAKYQISDKDHVA